MARTSPAECLVFERNVMCMWDVMRLDGRLDGVSERDVGSKI
jgi:hypothetical protein